MNFNYYLFCLSLHKESSGSRALWHEIYPLFCPTGNMFASYYDVMCKFYTKSLKVTK